MQTSVPPLLPSDLLSSFGNFTDSIIVTKDLNVGEAITVPSITGELGIFTNAIISGTTTSTSIGIGALAVGGGISVGRDINIGGHILSTQSTTLNLTVNVGSGLLTNATDIAGTVTLTVPQDTTPRTLCSVNFVNPYQVPPVVIITPAEQRTGKNELGISTQGFTGSFTINSGITSPGSEVTYSWYYLVIGALNTS
jgi:hypothetical protein